MRNRERVNSGLKTLSGAKPCIFSVKVAAVIAEGGSLFPRFRGSIRESGQQNVHRIVARARIYIKIVKTWWVWSTFGRWGRQNAHRPVARFLIKIVKKLPGSEHFWTMRSTKCARHCSESSISNWQCKKIVRVSDNFWKMSSANSARDHVAGVNKMRAGLFWARQFFTIFMWHRALATVSCTFYRPYLPKVFQTPQLLNTSKWKWSLCLKNCRDPSTFGRWGRQTVNETVVRSISPWTC